MTNLPDAPDDRMQTVPGFLIVCLGASAGGIEALRAFFTQVPADSGIAYVVMLHVSPAHESQLANVLQTATPLPVTQVTETVRVVPNHVYVVSPHQHLTMLDGGLTVSPNTLIEERRAPVDIFFRTLAETHHSRAVCVVLSGTGADGAMGLKRVKERGGVVFVQNPREASFNEMPRSAIATDLVDEVLPVAAIPARIMAYQASLSTIAIPVEADQRPAEQQALRQIVTQLRVRTGHDFSNYKRPTLLRRIARRINVRSLPDLPAYAAFVRENPDEVQALLKDLLISVTTFFRDKQAFAALEQEIIPRVFQGKRADEQVRIWVVGCATGEEAYSIAMLCAERVLGSIAAPSVQIIASDIDEAAIAHAREGRYTINDIADVSPEQLRRFFTLEDQRYRIRREIREMVLFANHNVLKDPPFSHLDLVICRNMLIGLNHTAQEQVMEVLHFALKPGGYLFLGTSESLDGSSDLFATVSREQRIFQRRATSMPALPEPDQQVRERISYGDLHQRLLEEYAPPSVLVNDAYEIVHLSRRAGRYLQFVSGEVSTNLLKVILPELRLELRSALYQAVQRQTNVQTGPLPIQIDERTETVTMRVYPVVRHDDPARGFLLVVLEQGAAPASDTELAVRIDEPVAWQLENEVQRLKRQLRMSSEQYQFQAEELKATDEELQALNVELRFSTEELELSKEELQSINEELRIVNQELKVKVEEATLHSTNLQNLVNSTDIGTIFLDRGLRVKLFTPAARELFNLISADYGRPLADITHQLGDVDVMADAETVLEQPRTIEREVRTTNGRMYLLRVLPYRAGADRISGVVITFVDITERARAEAALRESEAKYRTLFDSIDEGFSTIEVLFDESGKAFDYRLLEINPAFVRQTGIENGIGRTMRELASDHEAFWFETYGRIARSGEAMRFEHEAAALNPPRYYDVYAFRIGAPEEHRVAVLLNDISERKRAEKARRESEERFRLFVTAASEIVYSMSADWSEMRLLEGKRFLADTRDPSPAWLEEYIPESDRALVQATIRQAVRAKALYELEHRVIRIDGSVGWVFSRAMPFLDERGEIIEWLGAASDITERKRRETNLAFLAEVSAEFAPRLSAAELMRRVGERLATHLDLSRCDFSEVNSDTDRITTIYDWRRNLAAPSVLGEHHIATFLTEAGRRRYVAGELTAIDDAWNSPLMSAPRALLEQLDIGAVVNAPYLEHGRWTFLLRACRAQPTTWRPDEIELIRELAARISIRLERARAEEALRESEERLRLATEAAHTYSWEYDVASETYTYSANAAEILGVAPEGLPRTVEATFALVHPDDRHVIETLLQQARESGEGFMVDFRSIKRSGDIIWLSVQTTAVNDARGNLLRIVGIAQDVTERKRAEAALRESEERFRTLADAVPQVIWANDAAGKAIYFNQRWFAYSGLSYEQSAGPGWQAIVHPDDAPASVERWQRALGTGQVFDTEYRLRRGDGVYRWFIGRNVPLRDESGQIVGWFGSATDIEDLKQAEAARRESEERFRLLVEGARDHAMFLLDPQSRVTYWSVGAERVFGYTEAEALGQRGALIFTPEDRAAGLVEREIQTALDQGSALDRRWHVRKDGARLFLDGALIRLDDEAGKLRGFAKIGRDATMQHEAEEALQRAHDQLESRVQERISELAAANLLLQQEIAERRQLAAQRAVLVERILTEQETERQRISRELHDTLGQFLSVLNMRLSMARSLEAVPSQVREELARLLALSSQIDREVDRLTMELRPPALEDFGLADALRSYAEQWSITSGAHVDVLVLGLDGSRLRPAIETTAYRIVQEALTNVLKHAQASVVSVVVERQSGALRIIVEDNGVGFEAGAGIASSAGGRQVGLIGMSERAALVGGELTIETAPGAGTTIYLHIPLGEDTTDGTGNAHE